MTGRNFSSISIEQLYVQLQSSGKGVSTALAEQRIKEQLKFFKKEPRFKRELKLLIRQFTNPLVLLLVIAVILAAVLGESSDSLDFITFYVLYYYFRLSGSSFQTGWFLESAITELLILYIIRTRKSFIKSKPGKWLLITGIIAFCITIYLPFSPFASLLGLSVAHAQQIIAIALILLAYTVTADLLKIVFFRISEKK